METRSPESSARDHLTDFIASDYSEGAFAVSEFWIPLTHERADLAVVGPLLEGFEIKTSRDNLRRLPRQVNAYGRVFNKCHLVVAENHLDSALEIVPEWWGVLVLTGDASQAIDRVRAAQENPGIDAETVVQLLWKGEAIAALDLMDVAHDSHTSRPALWQKVLEHASDRIGNIARDAIATRDFGSVSAKGDRLTPLHPISA